LINIKKGDISLVVEEPGVGYGLSRFDWTGKIVQMYCGNIPFCTDEIPGGNIGNMGRGFYNEFGIDRAIGYEETSVGDSFPKIGVGYLIKDSGESYDFFKSYDINSFDFKVFSEESRVVIHCTNDSGKYPFFLEKEISIRESGFRIRYQLENRGTRPLNTTEYTHNFLSPGGRPVGEHSSLIFNRKVDPVQFQKGLNPDNVMTFQNKKIQWGKTPRSDFFYENISGSTANETAWTLTDNHLRTGIRETVDFEPMKINLWGRAHVVSPEVFKEIGLAGGESDLWSREYTVFSQP